MIDSPTYSAKLRTPFAVLGVKSDGRAVTRLVYLPLAERAQAPSDKVSERLAREVERYLADPAYEFEVPLATGGTAFQQRVWQALSAIPPGESRTYGEVARMVRSSARAVGQACAANRIALIVPCHRVVGAMGSLGGFMNAEAGEPIAIKRWLLTHEGYRFGA
jgi:methylated-DNA-[protein]-cysteine S-methyltransferase